MTKKQPPIGVGGLMEGIVRATPICFGGRKPFEQPSRK